MLNAFWRDEPLSDNEIRLIEALDKGHREAALRQNISSVVLQAAYAGSGDFLKSVVAAISTLGGTHAPIIQAYEVLKRENGRSIYIGDGYKVAGWGNSFVKGMPDKTWDKTSDLLNLWPDIAYRIEEDTKLLHGLSKNIYPNAACYTAATAIIIGLPKDLSPWLVIQARLPEWAKLIYDIQRQSSQENLRNN